jgi:hypothetical protein
MTFAEFADFTRSVGYILGAVGVGYTAWKSYTNGRHINRIERATNGMKDELVAEVRRASIAQGRREKGDEDAADAAAGAVARAAVAKVPPNPPTTLPGCP